MHIDGIAAIVTGGGSGLGYATAEMLAKNGALVTIFDLNRDAGYEISSKLGIAYEAVDVTDDAGVASALEKAETANGGARILVNCAGIAPAIRIVDKNGAAHSLDAYRRAVEINLIGTFNLISKTASRLIAAGVDGEEAGVFINTASVAAYDGQIGQAAYASSKAGVAGLTLPAARDLAQHRIRVMAIAPGIFLTPMMASFSQEIQDSLGRQVPHPSRLGQPSEYACLVQTVIGNPMLNGEVIRLDGAIRMAPR
ncbi:SDR family NAD(P)-dependent oxidoreductase [Sphingobium phenoxybenzoativorans]|uniref:SDR family NAD(P)-dependent oxidoreductase n=1 Tax=Sphingobium phenoxybenzoativorans TaxID=1592790 RepID=UPI000872C7DE|nr:SDR family NAD(P)-dependent oxidoreductase [Sphingobium phenoxybenzoativorans]